jgi:hypothetical protein
MKPVRGDDVVLLLFGKVNVEGSGCWCGNAVNGMLASAHVRTILTASTLFSQYFSERVLFEQTSDGPILE